MADKYANFPAHMGMTFTPTTYQDAPPKMDPSKIKLPSPCAVLITGAGRGLGEAYAIAFAQAGASDIILASRTTSELKSVAAEVKEIDAGIKVSVLPCDISDEKAVIVVEKALREKHGRLDVLINNAAFLDHGWCPLTEVPIDEVKRAFDVNIVGAMIVTKTFLPLLLDTKDGLKTIISITSMSSHVTAESISMGLSKLALNRFMEYVAARYGDQGVMSYALHPGGVKTAMSQAPQVPPSLAAMCTNTPELSAAMVVWLAKEPRPWLNGRYIASNWDVDELEAMKDEIVKEDKLKFHMVV
jgi:NAD(P)-dependent dehydrogenase (short-subunit alcohol dehydrogenase family)